MAMRQRGNGDDQSIAMAMAMGKEDWGTGATGAMGATGATGQRRSHCIDRSIDRSIVCVCGRGAWGAGVGVVYSVFYSEKLVNAKWRSN
jgi:hypothetical protein